MSEIKVQSTCENKVHNMTENNVHKWWETTTIYQIYPRSFMDSDGDGVGDLEGIISKLDYLKDLGFETLWISPFYMSAQSDHGYDISDYYHIDPLFGSDADADRLIQAVHNKGMKILFDMVMNHTSIEHSWFKESRESVDSPKRDWYIWRPGKGDKKPPNNWMSMTGKKGWNYDSKTDEWYYASFLNFQPDLNYKNPEVVQAMFDVVRYWLDKGVDGFRLDIFNCIGKDESMRDNPFSWRYFPTPENNHACFFQEKLYNYNHPDSLAFSKKLRAVIDEYPDKFLIGEVSGDDAVLKQFMGSPSDGLHTVFLFELIHYQFSKTFFKTFMEKIETHYPAPYVPTYVFSNHDIGRYISRVQGDLEKAKCIALFQMTNRGIPVLYYGDEIGMTNHDLPIKTAQDPLAKQFKWVPKRLAQKLDIFLNRDDCRTPMHWSHEANAGFSSSPQTWLPTLQNRKGDVESNADVERNVAAQQNDPTSLLNTHKALLEIRKNSEALKTGQTHIIESPQDLLVYSRQSSDEHLIILINFGSQTNSFHTGQSAMTEVYKTSQTVVFDEGSIVLGPYSGAIVRVKK